MAPNHFYQLVRVLPPNLPGDVANWTVGSTPRVAWGMRFNHGGGYQYRLCPLEKMPCSEEEFQKMPLDFVKDAHAIVSSNSKLLYDRLGVTGFP